MKVGIINFGNILNRGCDALLDSKISILKELNPKIEISVFSFHPTLLKKEREELNVYGHYFQPTQYGLIVNILLWLFRVIIMFNFIKFIYFFIGRKAEKFLSHPYLKRLNKMDLIVSSGGDDWSEDYGFMTPISCLYLAYISKLMGKKVVLWGESMGPFKNKFLIQKMKKYLPKIDIIGVREPISFDYMKKTFNLNNIILTWDTAFVLPVSSIDNINSYIPNREYFCISFSQMISRYAKDENNDKNRYEKYTEIMANIVDYLIESTGFKAVIISHVFELNSDDRLVSKKIFEKINKKNQTLLIEEELKARQFKTIISKSKFFIGSRMHPVIAALSMNVPSVSISYSIKYHGIIGKMFNIDKYIYDVRNGITIEGLKKIIDEFLKEYHTLPNKFVLINKQAKTQINNFAVAFLK